MGYKKKVQCPECDHEFEVTVGQVGPDPDGEVTAKCLNWKVVDGKNVRCHAPITGTRKQLGQWGMKCSECREKTQVGAEAKA